MKGLIFDLDGTLYNSLEDIGRSANQILENHGFAGHPLSAYQKFVGNGLKNTLLRALPDANKSLIDALFPEFLKEYHHHYRDHSKPYDKAIETLGRCNELNIPIAVCTNKNQAMTDAIIQKDFASISFVAVIGDQADGHLKPDPKSALNIAKKMALEPKDIYFVGDSDVDMLTAKNAGMNPVGVSWGFRDVTELKAHGAKRILESLEDVLMLVK